MKENQYQSRLIRLLKDIIPDCIILKNDSSYMQGVPDIIILFENRWAMLEVKRDAKSSREPNQDYYLELFDRMSFAALIEPSNEEEVLYELQRSFGLVR